MKNQKIKDLNNIISTIATIIYKYKTYCKLKDIDERRENISIHVQGSFKTCSCVYKRVKCSMPYPFFEKSNSLYYVHITKYYICYQIILCKKKYSDPGYALC